MIQQDLIFQRFSLRSYGKKDKNKGKKTLDSLQRLSRSTKLRRRY
jgi:hypothetical protein